MNVDDLVVQAVAEAHREDPTALQQALGALIKEHENRTGTHVSAECIQLHVDMQKTDKGLAFTYSLLILPSNVLPLKPIVRKRRPK